MGNPSALSAEGCQQVFSQFHSRAAGAVVVQMGRAPPRQARPAVQEPRESSLRLGGSQSQGLVASLGCVPTHHLSLCPAQTVQEAKPPRASASLSLLQLGRFITEVQPGA